MSETRCIPVNYRYWRDPPNTDWWVMEPESVRPFEDELPILAEPGWRVQNQPAPAPALPGTFRHVQKEGCVVITLQVPCDEAGRIDPDVRLLYQQKADDIFWLLFPQAELV